MNTAKEILEKKAFNAPFGAPNLPELPSWKSVKSGVGDMLESAGNTAVRAGESAMRAVGGVMERASHIGEMPPIVNVSTPAPAPAPTPAQPAKLPSNPAPVNQWNDAALDAEFKRRHATHFDPHSKMDRGKMRIMKEKLGVGNTPSAAPALKPAASPQAGRDWNALFKKHHATSFDPHSSEDRAKMQALRAKYGH